MHKYDPVIQRAIKQIKCQGMVQDGQLKKVPNGLELKEEFLCFKFTNFTYFSILSCNDKVITEG